MPHNLSSCNPSRARKLSCMVITYRKRVWINRVRLPTLLVVSWTGKMNISLSPFAPENLFSRDGFGSPVPRQPAHLYTQAEYGAYLRDSSQVPRRGPSINYIKPPHAIGPVPSFRRHRASKPRGSSTRVLPWRRSPWTNQYAPLFPTPTIRYWYEVGMLKVPAVIGV